MVRSPGAARMLLALLGALGAGACRDGGTTPGDGGTDATPTDGPAGELPGALALDFSVTGCATYTFTKDSPDASPDKDHPQCSGAAPLTLSFAPVSSGSFTRFLWTFGDGTPPSSERAPTHRYVLPGTYDVSVVAEGMVGTLMRMRVGFVRVAPVTEGAPCDVDGQCEEDLGCLCGSARSCGPAFPRGVCTRSCAAAACGAASVCGVLDVPASSAAVEAEADAGAADATIGAGDAALDTGDAGPDAGAPPVVGPTPLCLVSCAKTGCPEGLVCRALPAAGGGQERWAMACVPPAYRAVGDTCRDASGALDDDLCSTGRCADLGALGLCTATCGAGAVCPTGSACATLGNGQSLCLRACMPDFACDRDPLLACEAAGSAGPLGFQVTPATPGATYCAPRKCAAEAECDPAGTCLPPGVGGHCQRP